MAEILVPPPVLPVFAITFQPRSGLASRALEMIEGTFGPLAGEYEQLDFNHTDYYEKEMGRGLKKLWIRRSSPESPDNVNTYKKMSNEIERRLSEGGRRRCNIDPGYVSLSGFFLFSAKNFSHRVYIGGGIYAELTLIYRGGRWDFLEWTYPDYKEPVVLDYLRGTRRALRDYIKTRE